MNIFMFHSIGLESSNWVDSYLSMPVKHFDEWFKYLSKKEYESLFLEDWYLDSERSFIKNDRKLVITFDDGYLDNWVYLFPLLQKYQIRATIFINPEFVDPSSDLRPTLSDVWSGNKKESDLQPVGFLNWNEIAVMQNSGLVDIQSHSMSHNWYFAGSDLVDVYDRDRYKKYYWMKWILDKESKPYYMVNNHSQSIPEGYPIFKHGRSLGLRRYFPNENLIDLMLNSTSFKNEIKDGTYLNAINKLLLQAKYMGRMETDREMIDRYIYELGESKTIIEKKLNKKVDFLCWPGGGYNNISIAVSEDVGYKASTIASWERDMHITDCNNYKRIPRFSLGTTINYKGKTVIDQNPQALRNIFLEFEGSKLKKLERYAKKMYYITFK